MIIFLLRLVAYCPLWFLHGLGVLLGWLTYGLSRTYRTRLKKNLCDIAGYDQSILRQAIGELGKATVELCAVWLRTDTAVLQLIRTVHHADCIAQAKAAGKSIVFVTPHLGCFEITSLYYAHQAKLSILYRPPKLKWLTAIMEEGRQRGLITLAPANLKGVRILLRALKNQEDIGILPDQVPAQGEGIEVSFFGQPAYTMTLAARFARHPNTCVIFAFAKRLPWGRGFELFFQEVIMPTVEMPNLRDDTQFLNHQIERLIRSAPAQYLWSYNRYKMPQQPHLKRQENNE